MLPKRIATQGEPKEIGHRAVADFPIEQSIAIASQTTVSEKHFGA